MLKHVMQLKSSLMKESSKSAKKIHFNSTLSSTLSTSAQDFRHLNTPARISKSMHKIKSFLLTHQHHKSAEEWQLLHVEKNMIQKFWCAKKPNLHFTASALRGGESSHFDGAKKERAAALSSP